MVPQRGQAPSRCRWRLTGVILMLRNLSDAPRSTGRRERHVSSGPGAEVRQSSTKSVSGGAPSATDVLADAAYTPTFNPVGSTSEGRYMSKWVIDGSGIAQPTVEVLRHEVRYGAVRRGRRPRVAIRLLDMVVHNNRRWFSGAAVRLDVLVLHGGATDAEYAPQTFTFPRIADGDHLPIGDGGLLLFHGQPRWFLTMMVAVSRDRPGAAPLSKRLGELMTSEPAAQLQAQTLALATGAPDPLMLGVAWQSALLLGSTMLATLSRETQSTSIGLYRDSWLGEQDRWGAGRHPERGLLKAQDVSFAFDIVVGPA